MPLTQYEQDELNKQLLQEIDRPPFQKSKIEELLKKGAYANVANDKGYTPLHFVAKVGSSDTAEIMRLLITHGAKINISAGDGFTPLHLAASNDLEVVQILLEHNAVVEAKNLQGETPLYLAAMHGNQVVVEELIKKGAIVNAITKYRAMPLHVAADNGKLEVIRTLLHHGAIVDAVNERNETALYIAAALTERADHIEIMRLLAAQGADVNAVNQWGDTSLHDAASRGDLETVEALISLHANVEVPNQRGEPPLHWAACYGHTAIVQTLINHHAAINARNDRHETPLHLAVERGHLETVQALIELRADLNLRDVAGHTPIQVAYERGQFAIVDLLQHHGAAQLPEHLRQHDPRQINQAQSVHEISVHKSVSESAAKLQSRYKVKNLNAARKSFQSWIQKLKADEDIKIQAAKRCLPRMMELEFTDHRSGISMENVIALTWLGATDTTLFNKQEIETNKVALTQALYEIQRGYNLDAKDIDDGGDDKIICVPGSFNKFIEALNGKHPDVRIIFVTKETIAAKAISGLTEEFYFSLPVIERRRVAKMWVNDGLDKVTLEKLQQFVSSHLHTEFDEFREQVVDYDTHIDTILSNLEFAQAPLAVIEAAAALENKNAGSKRAREELDETDTIECKRRKTSPDPIIHARMLRVLEAKKRSKEKGIDAVKEEIRQQRRAYSKK